MMVPESIAFRPGFRSDRPDLLSLFDIVGAAGDPRYLAGALVPGEPLKDQLAALPQILRHGEREGRDLGITVSLFELETRAVAVLRDRAGRIILDGDSAKTQSDAGFSALLEGLPTEVRASPPFSIIGFTSNPGRPSSRTATRSSDRSHYIGLHIDDWDNTTPEHRHTARNRICVNLGRTERYLYVVAQSFRSLHERHIATGGDRSLRPYSEVGRTYLRQNPEVPVVRCEIPPGWAYIAPTENCLHDGGRPSHSPYDLIFTVRGAFSHVNDQIEDEAEAPI
ncbi:hypothetical protein J2X41_000546 [Caulobacter sp. BE254]|nr:hypothetical protein [Caulobacter sp. BE254]